MRLAYRAYDGTGKEVMDTVEASNAVDATETLRRRGLFVTKIREDAAPARERAGGGGWLGRRRRLKNLAMFTRHLQVLVASGTPMMEALQALERQIQDRAWRSAIADVRMQVEEGRSLSEAMERRPGYFDALYRSLIAAGESSGKLRAMLQRLAVLQRKRLHVYSAIMSAMVYPALLLVVATGVLSLLLIFVVPRFGELFATLGAPLPASTKILIDISRFLGSYWWIVLSGIVAAVVAAKLWLGTPAGHRAVDTVVLRLPQLGRVARSFITARIARVLGMLLEARVSVIEAIEHARAAAGNFHYARLLSHAENAVIRGEPISAAFADTNLIAPCLYEAIRSGERSGQVGPLLLEIADFMDEDNETMVRCLTSIIEPFILIVLGLLVGLVALSLFTPLFDITAMT